MGLMKQYLMEKTGELAVLMGIDEAEFYNTPSLNAMAVNYAQYRLELEKQQPNVREEIKKAILTRMDEVVELIQEWIADAPLMCNIGSLYSCDICPLSFLCEKSTQYKEVT